MQEKIEKNGQSTAMAPPSRDSSGMLQKHRNTLTTTVIVGVLGFVANGYLQKRAEEEARVRIYNQLISEREKAESQLRSAMFSEIIGSFIAEGHETDPEYQVLNLELLVHNFHESLNVAPLFYHVKRQTESAGAHREELDDRLSDLAKEVSRKQLLALVPHGDMEEMFFEYQKSMTDSTATIEVTSHGTNESQQNDNEVNSDSEITISDPLLIDDIDLRVLRNKKEEMLSLHLFLQEIDPEEHRVKIRLEIEDKLLKDQNPPEFWLDYFDFPMIDNTRLSGGYRLAVTLVDFTTETSKSTDGKKDLVNGAARIAVVVYPEEYASLKDRAFLQDLLRDLMP